MKQNIVVIECFHKVISQLKLAIIKYPMDTITRYIHSSHHPFIIQSKDHSDYLMQEQFLKRFYRKQQYHEKIQLLSEYYKYHIEIPRIFLPKTAQIMEENTEGKRQLEYIKVTNKIKQIAKEQQHQSIDHQYNDKILDDLQLSSISSIPPQPKNIKRVISLHSKGFNTGIQPKEGLFLNRKNIKLQFKTNQIKPANNVKIKQIKNIIEKLSSKYNQPPKNKLIITNQSSSIKRLGLNQQHTTKYKSLSRSQSSVNIKQPQNIKSLITVNHHVKNNKSIGISQTAMKNEDNYKVNKLYTQFQTQNTTPQRHSPHQNTNSIQISCDYKRPQKKMFRKLIQAKKR